MVASIFETIGEALTGFMEVLTTGFTGITSLIWNGTDNTLTPMGIILLVGLGVGVVYFVFRFVTGLIRNVGKAN